MRLLLDSHVFIWCKCAPKALSDEARAMIIDPDNQVFVSVATAWELWIKHAKRPIKGLESVLDAGSQGFLDAAEESGIELFHVTLDHAAAAASLPRIHRDPFDRMLIAQAIVHKLTLITSDSIFERYPGLDVRLM